MQPTVKKTALRPRRLPAFAAGAQQVYAYENALDWFSLDPFSPYRGWDGAKRIAAELFADYNDDGKLTLAQFTNERGVQTTYQYIPPVPARVEVKPDSTIYYQSAPLPGGFGTIESRTAVPRP